jgi:hypothetical protein
MKIADENGVEARKLNELGEVNGFSGAPAKRAEPVPKSRRLEGQTAECAFALPEVMVGTAMFAVMAVSLYGGISFGFSNITLARQNLRATQIALEKMEITRMYSWDQVNSNGFVPTTFTAPFFPSTGSDTNGGLVYYGTTIITNVDRSTSYSNDMRHVKVSLTWTNRSVRQELEMSTFISQYGMQRYINQ